jgi:EAL domain-containing protein (putative c-di-GMP-specific phosphodiesterase class I)
LALGRIAIVDDEREIGELLSMALSDAGFEVCAFSDADRLLHAVEAQPFDAIILDLMMPGTDGVELLSALAERGSEARLVLVSGAASSVRRSAADVADRKGLKVVANLQKPVQIAELVDLVTAEVGDRGPFDAAAVMDAIERDEIAVHYQPVFRTARDVGATPGYVEALVRWPHPQEGFLLPGRFLPLVESCEDWLRLTMRVLRIVCADLATWRAAGFRTTVSFNVPPIILSNTDLPDLFDGVLQEWDVEPSALVLEIVEWADLPQGSDALATLTRLQLRGFGVSIDDFGVGHGCLQRIVELPFQQIKIDMSFVKKAPLNDHARGVIRSTVAFVKALDATVCAEGVEEPEELATVLELGVDFVQGFGLSRPKPASMIEFQFNRRCAPPPA